MCVGWHLTLSVRAAVRFLYCSLPGGYCNESVSLHPVLLPKWIPTAHRLDVYSSMSPDRIEASRMGRVLVVCELQP